MCQTSCDSLTLTLMDRQTREVRGRCQSLLFVQLPCKAQAKIGKSFPLLSQYPVGQAQLDSPFPPPMTAHKESLLIPAIPRKPVGNKK